MTAVDKYGTRAALLHPAAWYAAVSARRRRRVVIADPDPQVLTRGWGTRRASAFVSARGGP
ncbi:hypothetical protein GCM10017687_65480 [Streptomyces echinatus]